jgi:phage-related protein
MRTIQFYRTASGACPVEDSLPGKHAQKVAWVLRLVERLDVVPESYLKKLSGSSGLWEVRAQAGGNSYRLLGFFDGSMLLILTSGFSKKSRKAPVRELDLAQQRQRDYLRRKQS